MDHVRFITGPGSAGYRVYEPTIAGHLDLLRETLRLIEISMGWPLFIAGAAMNPIGASLIWLSGVSSGFGAMAGLLFVPRLVGRGAI